MSASSVTEYTDSLSEDGKKYVSDFIGFMRKQYPQIDSKICFSMPMWLAGEKMKDGYIAVSLRPKIIFQSIFQRKAMSPT